MGKKLTVLDFTERSKKIHNNRYNYDKVDYVNTTTKVKIVCFIHGEFEQNPEKHMIGQGCPFCGGGLKLNNEEFKKRAVNIHGNKYNYDKVNYIDALKKITIICKEHGEYSQKPVKHLQGQGCPKCANNISLTNNEFIKNAKLVHNNLYDYSLTEYVDSITKIKIMCSIHGIFEQSPSLHVSSKHGCPKCSNNSKKDIDFIINKFNELHKFLYDYSLVNYVNSYTKVKIICKKHGEFSQLPGCHITGQGCPSCKLSKGEKEINFILKENNINFKRQYYFKDLKHKSKLKFDFAILNDHNQLLYLIEFNGEQHYKFNTYFHKSAKDFLYQQFKDQLKKDYCLKNNIPLYIIKYNENISEQMDIILKKEMINA